MSPLMGFDREIVPGTTVPGADIPPRLHSGRGW